jgi:hypothetical protein
MYDVNRSLLKHLTESQFKLKDLPSPSNVVSSGASTPTTSGSHGNISFISQLQDFGKSIGKKRTNSTVTKFKSNNTPTSSTSSPTVTVTPKPVVKLTFGESFKKISPLLRLYTVYINGYPKANEAYHKIVKDEPLSQFLGNLRKNDPQFKGSDLSSLLIQPIQRLPRYGLLLETLVKNTPEFHYDYQSLMESYTLIKGITGELNEKRNVFESQKRIVEMTSKFPLFNAETESDSGVKHRKILNHRRYVKEEEFLVKSSVIDAWVKCDLFLYSDILLIGQSEIEEEESMSLDIINVVKKSKKGLMRLSTEDGDSINEMKQNHHLSNMKELNFPNLYLHLALFKKVELKKVEDEDIMVITFLDKTYEVKEIKKGTCSNWVEEINSLMEKDMTDLKKDLEKNMDLDFVLKSKQHVRDKRQEQIDSMNKEFEAMIEKYSKIFTSISAEEDLVDEDVQKFLRNDSKFIKEHFSSRVIPASKLQLSQVSKLSKNAHLSDKEVETFSKSFSFPNEKMNLRKEKIQQFSQSLKEMEDKKTFQKVSTPNLVKIQVDSKKINLMVDVKKNK